MVQGTVVKISGPLVVAEQMQQVHMNDVVRVGERQLIGEIIELHGDRAFIQVYEETAGVKPGEPVVSLEQPLSVVLGPGLIGSIFDGIQRPLNILRDQYGHFIARGVTAPRLDHHRRWVFTPALRAGDHVSGGVIVGEIQETPLITHRVLVPPWITDGEILNIKEGELTIDDPVAQIRRNGTTEQLMMVQDWPVRKPRPYQRRLNPEEPLVTGQRVIDTFFPITKGGTASVPGPFGSGKTVVQHQIAKWVNAEVIIFIGCGERGNEMTDVLMEFPELQDPQSGRPLMERTILVANTSNMPVAAREASIYTGITLAEYYRDMGYDVAVMADSTSRWAEALREIGGRLEEMPGEEGYPAYLGTRLSEFYERAGRVICLGDSERKGSASLIGAVSPPGGDLSDPVVQATLRVVKVFWSLEDRLAYERHFPAINWLTSYSLYEPIIDEYIKNHFGEQPIRDRNLAMRLLEEEDELKEIVRLVGLESLSPEQRVILRAAQAIREDFLHQNAFHEDDTYTSLQKQFRLLRVVIHLYEETRARLKNNLDPAELTRLPVMEQIARAKYIRETELDQYEMLTAEISTALDQFGEIPTNGNEAIPSGEPLVTADSGGEQ